MSLPLPAAGHALRALLARAGAASLDHFGAGSPRRKADGTWLTDADLAAEAVLLEGLRAGWPGEAILSEERGSVPGTGPARWVVDPLDGTSAFTEGLAHWGPTLARLVPSGDSERVDIGALWLPRLGEYYFVDETGAWMGDELLRPLAEQDISRVVYLPSAFHRHFGMRFQGKARCLGGTAAHLALVARGAARAAVVAPGWSIWDTATGLTMIGAVGGRALRLPDGAPLDPIRDTGSAFIAGDAASVEELASAGQITPLQKGAGHG
jgi:fructose-1,6-bisphosphatase/inositol monophosphatase family enzyme